ncbi:MAG: DUF1588 domain-containing protein [Alphaproteobacteria bacterium]|nr:DUF1588 domain-containing protein [Alphaproteobacteria bacterium]
MIRWPLVLAGAAACHVADTPPVDTPTSDAADPAPHVRALAPRELRYALEDLSGVALGALAFPEATRAGGFDNQDAATPVSDALVDDLDRAAETAALGWADALLGPVEVVQVDERVAPHGCAIEDVARPDDPAWLLWLRRGVDVAVHAPTDGTYVVEVPLAARISQQQAGFLTASVTVDGDVSGRVGLDALGTTVSLLLTVPLTAGRHIVTLLNANGLSPDADMDQFLRGPCQEAAAIRVDAVSLYGPVSPAWSCPTEARGDAPCVRAPLEALAHRAWRRPVDDDARERLTSLLSAGWLAGPSFATGLAVAGQAVLLSPELLLVPPSGTDDAPDASAVATRMALATWSSVPDDALLACAERGALLTDDPTCGLHAQLDRLLADPRATRMAEGLAHQWLGVERLDASTLPGEVPVAAMIEETVGAVQRALDDDRPLRDLVADTATVVRPELADWYAIRTAADGGVDLGATGRAGVLTHASVLTATSSGSRASAVRRAAWVREALRCDPPEPPPPGVPALDATVDPREALAAHTANPACSGCHATLDPLGLALDGFDAYGRSVAHPPSTAALPDGTVLPDAASLAAWVLSDDRMARCLVSRIGAWTLGTPVDPDAPAVTRWLTAVGDGGWRDVVHAVVDDPMFRGGPR